MAPGPLVLLFTRRISVPVRWLALLICIVLLHDIFVPNSTPSSSTYDGLIAVVTLDPCHTSGAELEEEYDEMPGMAEQSGKLMSAPPCSCGFSGELLFIQLLLTTQNERPPEA